METRWDDFVEDSTLSYAAAGRAPSTAADDNRLIQSDNLPALRALASEFGAAIKCIYIDPPYNTQQALDLYHDGIESRRWLDAMHERALLLRELLTADGSLFVHIDDNELGYLIVLLDQVFGRANRLYVVTFKQGAVTGHKVVNRGCVMTTNFLLVYAKNRRQWRPRRVFTVCSHRDKRYDQFLENRADACGDWRLTTLTKAFAAAKGLTPREARAQMRHDGDELAEFVRQNADSIVQLARPNLRAISAEARQCIARSLADPTRVHVLPRGKHGDMYFKRGQRLLFYGAKVHLIAGRSVVAAPLTTLWDDIPSNNLHKEGGLPFLKGKKPEALLARILELSTEAGDWVLDAFAGSGTTGAVAHKMGRRWILVEQGEHCRTHIIPRLKSVIDGTDAAGVTAATAWQGGGSYRFFRLNTGIR